jgi:dTDP-4-amino-4,6-dideoxygalactose transaminase
VESRRIPLSDIDYGPEEEAAVLRVLRSKWLSMGPEVEAFEREMAEVLGVAHAFAVANGTAALHLALLALNVGTGDEVVQPAVNFVAAANATVATGARPVFADILGLAEPTVDPAHVDRCLTPRTKAVIVMHYGGYPCRMAEIEACCRSSGAMVIEDACHAIGARYRDPRHPAGSATMTGVIGDVGCFSFFSNKNLAVGEGGLVVTRRADVAERLRLLRSHGMTTLTWDRHRGHAKSYDVTVHGHNYRLDELRAALGRCQLAKLERNNARRHELVARYRRAIGEIPGWTIPFSHYSGDSAHHLMVVVAPDAHTRNDACERLLQAGIQTSRHYPCIADFQAFQRFGAVSLEESRAFAARVITLPLFPTMAPADVDHVAGALRSAAAAHGAQGRPE